MTYTLTDKTAPSPVSLNSELNLWGPSGEIQFDKDKEAVRQFFLQEINPNTVLFLNVEDRLEYLIENGYYDGNVFSQYSPELLESVYSYAKEYKFRFKSYVGALKFYRGYALKTFDGQRYLETFDERVVATALALARGNSRHVLGLVDAILSGAYQPATPTFLNAGRKDAGAFVSCFLLDTQDSLESINATIASAMQLSKRGGGVAVNLSNIRAVGDPIKKVEGVSSGVVPYAKMLEDAFRWINQLGQRAGSCAVYIHAHHLDVLTLLDTKLENADEALRLRTLSVGVTIPDITYELAQKGEDMYLFSPYDVERAYGRSFSEVDITENYRDLVENPDIRKKKISARGFFQTIAGLRFESGYPYILNVDIANRANALEGNIKMSNLCSEILQPQTESVIDKNGKWVTVGKDISCNLGSMNVARAMETGADIGALVDTAIRSLTAVSQMTSLEVTPTIEKANRLNRSVGLGQMNLAGFFGKEKMIYGDDDSLEFTSSYFSLIAYHAYRSSMILAKELGSFDGFERSRYATGEYFNQYLETDYQPKREKVVSIFEKYGVSVPSREDWEDLREDVMKNGLANSHLQAIPPTGSISYVNHATASLTPIPSLIEIRKEGKMGRVYFPAPEMNNDNMEYFQTAYDLGPEAVIDVYAAATPHIDQGLSMNLFFKKNSMKDMVKSIMYAHKTGVKTVYYGRVQQQALEGTNVEECVSCAL